MADTYRHTGSQSISCNWKSMQLCEINSVSLFNTSHLLAIWGKDSLSKQEKASFWFILPTSIIICKVVYKSVSSPAQRHTFVHQMSYFSWNAPFSFTISSNQNEPIVNKQLYSGKMPSFPTFAIKRQYFGLLAHEIKFKCWCPSADLCTQIC